MVVEKVEEKKRKGNRQIHVEEENAQNYIAPIPMGKKNYFTFYRRYVYQLFYYLKVCVINVTALKPIPFSMN